jgi:DNA-binding XRE family transcriptional regulator
VTLVEDKFAELRKYHKPGYKLNRFRKPTKTIVVNRYLYGLMFTEDITTAEMAEKVGVSRSTVQKWIFEGRIPRYEEIAQKIASILNAKVDVIFNQQDIAERLAELDQLRNELQEEPQDGE